VNRGAVVTHFGEVNEITAQVKWIDPGPVWRTLEFSSEPDAKYVDVGAVIADRHWRSIALCVEVIKELLNQRIGNDCRRDTRAAYAAG
jgi:hypothetical protein